LSAAAVGAVQARSLGTTARSGPHPLGLILRLSLVTAVLVLAARADQLWFGAAGWALGFAATSALVYRRLE